VVTFPATAKALTANIAANAQYAIFLIGLPP
jgi:hypothetical protein